MSAPTVDVEKILVPEDHGDYEIVEAVSLDEIEGRARSATDLPNASLGHATAIVVGRESLALALEVRRLRARVAALEAERDRYRASARTLGRRNVAAVKVIARLYHDENGNPRRCYPDGMDEIGDILAGLCDDEIATAIDAARDAGRARGEG